MTVRKDRDISADLHRIWQLTKEHGGFVLTWDKGWATLSLPGNDSSPAVEITRASDANAAIQSAREYLERNA
jgi:hypothetical protein